MEYAFLLVIALLIILPSFMTMRKQKEHQNKLRNLQENLAPGQEVITAGGMHGTVVATTERDVQLQIAQGVVATFDKMAIVRTVEAEQPGEARDVDNARDADGTAEPVESVESAEDSQR